MSTDTPLVRRLKEGADGFSRNQRLLARHVLANYQSVAFATVAQLATQSGVSEATIVRFAQALDFSGYPELQKEIRRLVRAELRGVDRFKRGAERKTPARTPLDLITDNTCRRYRITADLRPHRAHRRNGALVVDG